MCCKLGVNWRFCVLLTAEFAANKAQNTMRATHLHASLHCIISVCGISFLAFCPGRHGYRLDGPGHRSPGAFCCAAPPAS